MRLRLTIEVPSNADTERLTEDLHKVVAGREGITIVTPYQHDVDVDLIEVRDD
jgi:hypothetical protein